MIRFGFLLVLFVIGQAQVQARARPIHDFNADSLIAVYAEGLSFVVPRIIEPVPVGTLTYLGLQGLSTFDASLRVVAKDKKLSLLHGGRSVVVVAEPKDQSPADWARVAVSLTVAARAVSPLVRRVGEHQITYVFFDQMFRWIDPYSRYVPPTEASADRARRAGRAGLGLVIEQDRGQIEVQSVIRDSPAALAGLRPGDILLAIDGQDVRDQDPMTVAALLAGPDGSTVNLSWKDRHRRAHQAEMERALVPPETVFAHRYNGMLVVRITGFSATTAAHLASSVQDGMAGSQPVDGIVLDLRDNGGGLLSQAVTAADIFLPAGLVATTTGRDPDAMNVWRSTEGELAEGVPLVILVDGRTASAAEIMTAALADRGRAVVVGSETVGKGMVQTIDPLPDGGELFVTWSQTLAPLGWPIQGLGVMPQVCTSLGAGPLERQLAALSTGFQPMAAAIARERAARLPVSASAALEIRAPCPAAEGHWSDLEAAHVLIANPAAYAAALLPPIPNQ